MDPYSGKTTEFCGSEVQKTLQNSAVPALRALRARTWIEQETDDEVQNDSDTYKLQ